MLTRQQRLLACAGLFGQLPIAVALQFGFLKCFALGGRQFRERLVYCLPEQRFQIRLLRRLRNAKQRLGQLILGKATLFFLAEIASQRQLTLFLALSVISFRAARNSQAAIFSTGCSTRIS